MSWLSFLQIREPHFLHVISALLFTLHSLLHPTCKHFANKTKICKLMLHVSTIIITFKNWRGKESERVWTVFKLSNHLKEVFHFLLPSFFSPNAFYIIQMVSLKLLIASRDFELYIQEFIIVLSAQTSKYYLMFNAWCYDFAIYCYQINLIWVIWHGSHKEPELLPILT